MMTMMLAAYLALPAAAAEGPLELTARYTRYAGDCAKRVVLEHAQSFPIPVKTAQGLRYRLMYYPVEQQQVYAPATVAQFDPEGDATCRVSVAMPTADTSAPLGPFLSPKAAKMSRDKYESEVGKLYSALERCAAAFNAGKADKSSAAAFQKHFAAVSEPPLLPFYRALSPDFWAWLEKK